MRKELENELEPINAANPHFWIEVTKKLIANPDKVLPVYLKNPTTNFVYGEFFFRLIRESSKAYLQAEGFDSAGFEKSFIESDPGIWKQIQPGIYRRDITAGLEDF